MKILHVCLGNSFTEDMLYKENYLIKANVEDGHDVLVLAPTLKWDKNKERYTPPEDKIISSGARLIRVEYDRVLNNFITHKIRKYSSIFDIVETFLPDVILFHCVQIFNIKDLRALKRLNKNMKIYGDVSTTLQNSATNFLSREILHKKIYKSWLNKAMPYFDKIFYVVPESQDFLKKVYKVPEEKLEFNPLGGTLTSYELKKEARKIICDELTFSGDEIVIFHSGKMNKSKKTLEILEYFTKVNADNLRLVIAGSFYEDIKNEAMSIINQDDRIKYVGFLTGEKLIQFLNASDLYVQPGTPSQTAQTAMCCFVPVILPKIDAYLPFYKRNGWLIEDTNELELIFKEILNNPSILLDMAKKSELIARDLLDYKKLASRIYI
jgi:glycosyltransferase involved in cell wall biosynthesis